MNYDKLKEIGLNDTQIKQVLSEHNKVIDSPINTDKQLVNKRKRDEIMAVEDTETRQRLIINNPELFR